MAKISIRFFKDIILVASSNATTILSGIAVSFLVPMALSLDDYSYYKTFSLYISYLGLFSLGLVDGVVLKYGGVDFLNINRIHFRSIFRCFFIIISLFSMIILTIGVIKGGNIGFIIGLVAVNLISSNIIGYFQQISQITQRFSEFSKRRIYQAIGNLALAILVFLLYKRNNAVSYKIYVIGLETISLMLMSSYIITYHSIIFGRSIKVHLFVREIGKLILLGFPLMFSNLVSVLIMSIDRQFVNILFSPSDYAFYSFAYSMLTIITVATSAVSTVIFPFLKRMNVGELINKYDFSLSLFAMLSCGMILFYFPLTFIIHLFLDKYINSIMIFRIMIPGIAISSTVHVVVHNYYKTINMNYSYFVMSLFVLVFSCLLNILMYYFFKSMISISIASVFVLFIWYVSANIRIKKVCYNNITRNSCFYILTILSFYTFSSFLKNYQAFFAYLITFTFLSIVFYRNNILSITNSYSLFQNIPFLRK